MLLRILWFLEHFMGMHWDDFSNVSLLFKDFMSKMSSDQMYGADLAWKTKRFKENLMTTLYFFFKKIVKRTDYKATFNSIMILIKIFPKIKNKTLKISRTMDKNSSMVLSYNPCKKHQNSYWKNFIIIWIICWVDSKLS